MKTTDKHVSDYRIDCLIQVSNTERSYDLDLVKALLELKQRRAEDRQREHENQKV